MLGACLLFFWLKLFLGEAGNARLFLGNSVFLLGLVFFWQECFGKRH